VVVALAAVAGYVDAVGYIQLGKLFVAHMSGNSAAAAADLGRGDLGAALHRVIPVATFVVGLFGGASLSTFLVRARLRSTHAVLFASEGALLAGAIAADAALRRSSAAPIVAVGLATTAMAVQSTAVARVVDVPVLTTAITGVLTRFAENVVKAVLDGEDRADARGRAGLYAAVWASFFLAATVGGFAAVRLGIAALGAPLVVLTVLVVRDIQRPFGARPPAFGAPGG
jgi:uncharacterized membrane protein YoaK (UPF0700 family)